MQINQISIRPLYYIKEINMSYVYMLTLTEPNGRLCNQIFRNIAVSMIAQKHNLYVKYSSHSKIKRLGIPLHVGSLKYKHTIELTDDNYLTVFHLPTLQTNLNANQHFFQTVDYSQVISLDILFQVFKSTQSLRLHWTFSCKLLKSDCHPVQTHSEIVD